MFNQIIKQIKESEAYILLGLSVVVSLPIIEAFLFTPIGIALFSMISAYLGYKVYQNFESERTTALMIIALICMPLVLSQLPLISSITFAYLTSFIYAIGLAYIIFRDPDNKHIFKMPSQNRIMVVIACLSWSFSFMSFFYPFIDMMLHDAMSIIAIQQLFNLQNCKDTCSKSNHQLIASIAPSIFILIALSMAVTFSIMQGSIIFGMMAFTANLICCCPCIYVSIQGAAQKHFKEKVKKRNALLDIPSSLIFDDKFRAGEINVLQKIIKETANSNPEGCLLINKKPFFSINITNNRETLEGIQIDANESYNYYLIYSLICVAIYLSLIISTNVMLFYGVEFALEIVCLTSSFICLAAAMYYNSPDDDVLVPHCKTQHCKTCN